MRSIDFKMITEKVGDYMRSKKIPNGVAMDYFVCETLLELNELESDIYITDSQFIKSKGSNKDDRGIDIFYLNQDAEENQLLVTLVSCKFKENYDSACSFSFPVSEFSKIESALNDLTRNPEETKQNFNIKQQPLIDEIINRYSNSEVVDFKVVFCSNASENVDQTRLSSLKAKFPDVTFEVKGCDSLIEKYRKKSRPKIDGKVIVLKKDMFDVPKGIVAKINAAEILRLFSKKEGTRNLTEFNIEMLKNEILNESVLRDNVRGFKGVTNLINKNIIETAENKEEMNNFLYYNNGLTILCEKIKRAPMAAKQILTLEGMQVVNGGQTLRCLDELKRGENIENLENIELLCRIYEIEDKEFSEKVAEYTNSQTAVTLRDIKSIDENQRNLQELISRKGYFYQAKGKEFSKENKEKVIDMEKIAQCIYAFKCDKPAQARNNKKEIFETRYSDIFDEQVDDTYVISLFELMKLIEKKRNEIIKAKIANDTYKTPEGSFVINADYFMLYGLKKLYLQTNPSLPQNFETLFVNYDKVYDMLETCVKNESRRKLTDKKSAAYSNSAYFKSNNLKEDFDKMLK